MAQKFSLAFDNVRKVELCKQHEDKGNRMVMWVHYEDGSVDFVHFMSKDGKRIERVLSDQVL